VPVLIDKKTGRPVDLPDELANRALASGSHAPQGGSVRIVAQDGQVYDVDAADAQAEIAKYGSRLETAGEASAAARKEELGGGLGQVAAGVTGAIRGATMGGIDVLGEALGFAPLMEGLREENPGTSLVTEIGGQVATGGLGSAAAGRAVGKLAGKALAPLAAKGALGRIAAKGLTLGAEGATEGGLTGIGQYMTEASLGEVEPGAEALLASVGLGTVLGGGMGMALGGAFQAGSEGWGRIKDVAKHSKGIIAKGVSVATGVPEETFLRVLEGRGKLGLAEDAPEIFGRKMAQAVDVAEESADEVTILWKGKLKKEWEKQVITEVGPENMGTALLGMGEGDQAVPGLLQNIKTRLDEAVATAKAGNLEFSGMGQIKAAAKLTKTKIEAVEEVMKSGRKTAAAELAGLMDDYKRSMGYMRDQMGRAGLTPELQQTLGLFDKDIYEPVMKMLQDPAMVGETFAAAQQEINASFTKLLGLQGSQARQGLAKMVGKRPFLTDEAQLRGELIFQSDPKGYETLAKALGEDPNAAALTKDYVLQRIQRQDDLLQTMAKHYDMDATARSHVDRVHAMRQEIEGLLSEGEALGALRRDVVDLETGQRRSGFGAGAGAVVGGLALGPIGAAVGGVAGTMLSPATMIRRLNTLDRLISGWKMKVSGSVGRYVGNIGKAARRAAVPAAVRAEQYLKETSFESHTGRDDRGGKVSTPEAYRSRFRELSRLAQDPRHAQDQLQRSTGELQRVAPQFADAARVKAVQAAQYLVATAPRSMRTPSPFAKRDGSRDPVPGDVEIAQWARRIRAADHPETVLQDLEHRSLTREAVETMRAVHPRLYADLVAELQDNLAELREELPHSERLSLSILFGVPVEPTAAPDAVASWQASYRQADAAGMGATQTAAAVARPTQAGLSRIKPAAFASAAQRLEAKA
jgi:hypothetical protein